MTNLLHRHGSVERLQRDYVFKNKTTKGMDDATPETRERTVESTRELIRLLARHHPVNMGHGRHGCLAAGSSLEELAAAVGNAGSVSGCVFSRLSTVKEVLQDLLDRDLGQSITVSGLIEEVFGVCREIGLEPHSVLLSLGIWGRRELLPPPGVLDIATMCGHALVSRRLVERVVRQVRSGELTPRQAADVVARPCRCGAVNMEVAADIIAELAASSPRD